MAQYPHLVQLAWYTVDKLVLDWAKNPYYWEKEIDIQAELRSRLALAYSVLGVNEVVAVESDSVDSPHEITYRYSRAACEPSIRYKYKDGQVYRAMPDVVIWDDLPDPRKYPEDNSEEVWPILWACEIKYVNAEPTEWDIEKLGYLLDQERIQYGCWLTFALDSALKKPITKWDKVTHGARLWKCTAIAPDTPAAT
jgi:hypothetical protein